MMKKKLFALSCAVLMTMSLAACGSPAGTPSSEGSADENNASSGVEDGVLTVAMECAYAPYNWTQNDDSNGRRANFQRVWFLCQRL